MMATAELKRMPTGRLVEMYAHRRDHGVSAEWGVVCDELNRRLLLVGTAVAVDGNHLVAGDPYHNRHGSFPVTIGVAPPEDVDRVLRNRGEAIDAPPAPGPQAPPAVAEAAVDDDGGEEPWPPVAGQRVEAEWYGSGDAIVFKPATIIEPHPDVHDYFRIGFDHSPTVKGRHLSEIRRPAPSDSAATAFLGDEADPAHERAMAGEGVELG